MKTENWGIYGFWILLSEAVGVLSGWLTREGIQYFHESVTQPPLSPPSIVFPIVWGILYLLMGISAAKVSLSSASSARSRGLNLFVLHLAVNFLWGPIFFNVMAYGFAFFWMILLWVIVLLMIHSFRKADALSAKLQIPYLIWLTFAAYLNLGVWYLNR